MEKKLQIYDLLKNMHFTLKTNTLRCSDLDEFVRLYNPVNRHDRKPTFEQFRLIAADLAPESAVPALADAGDIIS